jgi:hypothetical protein
VLPFYFGSTNHGKIAKVAAKVGGAYRVIIELQAGNLRVNFRRKIILKLWHFISSHFHFLNVNFIIPLYSNSL